MSYLISVDRLRTTIGRSKKVGRYIWSVLPHENWSLIKMTPSNSKAPISFAAACMVWETNYNAVVWPGSDIGEHGALC